MAKAKAASKPEELKELQATLEKEKAALIEAQKSTTQDGIEVGQKIEFKTEGFAGGWCGVPKRFRR